MKTMIAIMSWEIGESGECPSVSVVESIEKAREWLLDSAWEPEHAEDETCRRGPAQLSCFEDPPKDMPEVTCERCRIDGYDPAEGDFFLFPNAGRGDMQVCATVVEVPC